MPLYKSIYSHLSLKINVKLLMHIMDRRNAKILIHNHSFSSDTGKKQLQLINMDNYAEVMFEESGSD